MPGKRGLIVEVTENDIIGAGANPILHAAKIAQKLLPLQWATELAAHNVSVLAITPGFLRSESMLDRAGLSSTENFIFNDGFVERLRFEIDPGWQGDIPRTMLISRDGVITTIEGSAEIAYFEKWSAQQLTKH